MKETNHINAQDMRYTSTRACSTHEEFCHHALTEVVSRPSLIAKSSTTQYDGMKRPKLISR